MIDPNQLDDFARKYHSSSFNQVSKKNLLDEITSEQRYVEKEYWREGGMKQIYKVMDRHTGRHLAMAELKSNQSEHIEPFLREARLTSSLEHPNIISIHEIGCHENGTPYFTMDFLRDRTLEQLLQEPEQDSSTIQNRLEIFLKVCDAIDYAHSKGVVHLDIKPSNIHIGLFGEVWVCDWGIGKSLLEPDTQTESPSTEQLNQHVEEIWTLQKGIKGSPGNMAPEQIKGYEHANKYSDIYSIGILLYEVLYLKKPFNGTIDEQLKATEEGNLSKIILSENQPQTQSLNSIIIKATQHSPKDRYSSISELKQEVELFINGYSTRAENAGFLKEVTLFVKRHRWASIMTLLITSLSVFIISLFISELNRRTSEATNAAEVAKHYATQMKSSSKSLIDQRDSALQKSIKLQYVLTHYKLEKHLLQEPTALGDLSNPKAFLEKILKLLNPKWTEEKLNYNSKTQTLKINHPELKVFAYLNQDKKYESPLQRLPIKHLNLSRSGVYNLDHFNKMNLESLDLRKTNIIDLSPLESMKSLKKLILNTDQFSQEVLKNLPKHLTVETN